MRTVDFSDSFEATTAPAIGDVAANQLPVFANDAAFVTANGTATEGDIYWNSTLDVPRAFDGSSWISIQTSATAANVTLSNLTAPTAINVAPLPGTDNTLGLGSASKRWLTADITSVKASAIQNTSGVTAIDVTSQQLETGGTVKLDWSGTNIDINTRKIVNVVDPSAAQDVATKNYSDAGTATLTNKSIDADTNTITNIDNNEIKALAGIDATKIADGSVTSAEFQYLANVTSDIQTQLDGKQATGSYISSLTGDVTATGPGAAAATIANDTVTFAKMQNISTDVLLGRDTAATGDPEQISLNATLEFTGSSSIQRAALTGDVTASAGSNSTTIANDAVSNAKLADMAQSTIKGRAAGAGTGDPTDLTAAQATAILNIFSQDTKGLASGPTAGEIAANTFLRADNTWQTVSAGSSGLTPTALKTANYTAANGDLVVCDASGGAFTVTLPAGASGFRVGVKKIKADTSFNKVTIDGNGAETLDAALTRKLCTFNEYMEYVWVGTYWTRVVHTIDSAWVDNGAITVTATVNPTKGTIVTDKLRWQRQAGGLWHGVFNYAHSTAGSGGTGNYNFAFPTGVVADTAILPALAGALDGRTNTDQASQCGYGHAGVSGTARGNAVAFLRTTTTIEFIGEQAYSFYAPVGSTGFGFGNANIGYNLDVLIPAVDWE